jgi:hypothetical protein
MPSPRASLLALALLASCRRPGGPSLAPRYLLGLSPGPSFAVLGATLYADRDLQYRDASCLGTSLAGGREPPMLDGGRLDLWVVGGDPIGHVDRSADGRYHAAVRTALEPGTRVAGSLAGSNDVPAHRFHSPPHVPLAVQRIKPDAGFTLRAGEGLPVSWRGGDSTHVALVVTVSHGPADAAQTGWLLTCVVPRGRGRFVIPAGAFPRARVPADADTVTVNVAADDRVVEEEYALDVTPVGSAEDQAVGAFAR